MQLTICVNVILCVCVCVSVLVVKFSSSQCILMSSYVPHKITNSIKALNDNCQHVADRYALNATVTVLLIP